MTTARIAVLLVDDHVAVRSGLRVMLNAEPDLVVVGEAADGAEALRRVAEVGPDVVVLDLAMPGIGGLAAIPEIRAASPRTGILIFTMHANAAYVSAAMRAGARGYVLKSARQQDLLAAIRAVHAGHGFLQPEITGPSLRRVAAAERVAAGQGMLTAREIQILEAVADGRGNKEIAAAIGIAEDTVKTHLRHLFEKLGASDRAQAVAIALRQRLIE
jgi:DNA-binding NarL/FixJ family response regulator